MNATPTRFSLAARVAEVLRNDLGRGKWRLWLPSESELCHQLKVSRNTVRAALQALQREGLVSSSQGSRRRILHQPAARRLVHAKVVGWLTFEPPNLASPETTLYLDELRRHAHNAGYELVVIPGENIRSASGGKSLANLVRRTRAACWVLAAANSAVQRWFYTRKQHTVVLGSCHEGIHLPCVDADFRAESRHAVGQFLGLGHRVIALVIPRTKLAGDLASEAGFREGVERAGRKDVVARIAHHDLTAESVQRAVGSLWDRPHPPTAILAGRARHFLTVLTHLTNTGLRVPRDVSLISREHEWFLDNVIPSVACYRQNTEAIAARFSRMVVQLASTGVCMRTPILFMPRFREGDTLAHPRG